MGRIALEKLAFYAPIGWYPEEQQTLNRFEVSVWFDTFFTKAAASDALADTVNYEDVLRIVREEMAVPRKLIETAGSAIVARFSKELPAMQQVKLRITKLNPFPAQPGNVCVEFTYSDAI